MSIFRRDFSTRIAAFFLRGDGYDIFWGMKRYSCGLYKTSWRMWLECSQFDSRDVNRKHLLFLLYSFSVFVLFYEIDMTQKFISWPW
jgi:hypothetical protein